MRAILQCAHSQPLLGQIRCDRPQCPCWAALCEPGRWSTHLVPESKERSVALKDGRSVVQQHSLELLNGRAGRGSRRRINGQVGRGALLYSADAIVRPQEHALRSAR